MITVFTVVVSLVEKNTAHFLQKYSEVAKVRSGTISILPYSSTQKKSPNRVNIYLKAKQKVT